MLSIDIIESGIQSHCRLEESSLRRLNEAQWIRFGSSREVVELLKRGPGVRNFVPQLYQFESDFYRVEGVELESFENGREQKGLMPRTRARSTYL